MGLSPTSTSTLGPSATPGSSSDGTCESGSCPSPTLPVAFSPDSVEWEEWRGDWPFIHHAIAGSFAGVMEHLVMYPIDTIKTRMQAFRGAARVSQQPCAPSTSNFKGQESRCVGKSRDGHHESVRRCDAAKSSIRPAKLLTSPTGGVNLGSGPRRGTSGISVPIHTPRNLHPVVGLASPLRSVLGTFHGEQSLGIPGRQLCFRRSVTVFSSPTGRWPVFETPLCGVCGGKAGIWGYARRGAATTARAGNLLVSGMRGSIGAPLRGSSLLSGLRSVYVDGGFRGLYRGAGAVVVGCVPAHACYFMSYELVKDRMWSRARKRQTQQQQQQQTASVATGSDEAVASSAHHQVEARKHTPEENTSGLERDCERDTQGLTHGELLACGLCATLSHDLILTPVDVIKQRMQLGCFRTLADCVTATLRSEGPLAFVRSLPVSVLLNLPHGATLVYANDTLKNHLTSNQTSHPSTSLSLYFLCAGLSGGIAGLISNPLDVVKTRLQTQDCAIRQSKFAGVTKAGSCPLWPCPPKYQSLCGTVKTIWLEEGLQGFWRGVSSRVCLCIPATAICWGSYETFKFLWHASASGT